jgi:hypothetical protein
VHHRAVRGPPRIRRRDRLLARMYLSTLQEKPVRQCGSITLIDANLDENDDRAFFRTLKEALALLQRLDPRRYRRLEANVRLIINTELTALAQYLATLDCCRIDFARLRVFHERFGREWVTACVAATLVHESTHGFLCRRGFRYVGEQRRRIERMCVKEEQRFLRRVDDGLLQLYPIVRDFDAQLWEPHWRSGRWKQLRELLKRLRTSSREAESGAGKSWDADQAVRATIIECCRADCGAGILTWNCTCHAASN